MRFDRTALAVSTQDAGFLAGVRGSSALAGAARDRVIATAEPGDRPSKYGTTDTVHGGLTMSIVGRPADFNAFCGGGAGFNDFYGRGIVNALAAVGG